MKKTLSTILALVLVLALTLGCVSFAAAEEIDTAKPYAYLMYADGSWAYQYWGADPAEGVTPTDVQITGPGAYTVGLEFAEEAQGLAFSAIGIKNGEMNLPGYTIELKAVRVNGEEIAFSKGYTSSDDGIETRMNLYNEWVGDTLPADARSYDGSLEGATPMPLDKEAFAAVKKVEVDFVLHKATAYIMYANADWSVSYWGGEAPEGVTATNVEIAEPGDYTVGLEFAAPAEGLAFTALGLTNGELSFPGAFLKINEIRINGEAVAFEKGYTSSDDQITTRMNVYNEWVGDTLPEDAHSFDGSIEDAKPVIVDKELFASVSKFEIDFTLVPVTDTAYLMYADATWAKQYWGDDAEGVTATNAEITGPGSYTVGLEFAEPAEGLAFTAVGIKTGEQTFNGYFIDITSILINGEIIPVNAGYTSSDDGICTRENIYNEWVGDTLPSDARRADGNLEGASPMIVDKEAFASVKTIEVNFDFIYGKPVEKSDAPLTEEEAAELQKVDYNAYIGVQSETYIFRNTWDEANYGRDSQDNPECFGQLTGWDADNNKVNYGGTFEDVLLTKDGTYTVSLTTGDMGFGSDTFFRMLFVSTEIPAKLVRDGFVTISDVQVKIGDAATQQYTDVDTAGDYARIIIIDEYNRGDAPFGYNVPGANATISITFTVTGLTD